MAKVDLPKHLEDIACYFSTPARERGTAYWVRGEVRVSKAAPWSYQILVMARRDYQLHVSLEFPTNNSSTIVIRCQCTCPDYNSRAYCRHLWGAILALNAREAVGRRFAKASGNIFLARKEVGEKKTSAVAMQPMDEITPQDSVVFAIDLEKSQRSRLLHFVLVVKNEFQRALTIPLSESVVRSGKMAQEDSATGQQLLWFSTPPNRYQESNLPKSERLPILSLRTLSLRERLSLWNEQQLSPLLWQEQPMQIELIVEEDFLNECWRVRACASSSLNKIGDDRVVLHLSTSGVVVCKDEVGLLDESLGEAIRFLQNAVNKGDQVFPFLNQDGIISLLYELPPHQRPTVRAPAALCMTECEGLPTPILVISKAKDLTSENGPVQMSLEWDYDGRRVASTNLRPLLLAESNKLIRRDFVYEYNLRTQIESTLGIVFRSCDGSHQVLFSVNEALKIALSALQNDWRVEIDGKRLRSSGGFSLRVGSGIDWLEVEGTATFNGTLVPFPALLQTLGRKSMLVELANGEVGLIAPMLHSQLSRMAPIPSTDDVFRVSRQQALLVLELVASAENAVTSESFATLRNSLDGLRDPKTLARKPLPPEFRGTLRTYQETGLAWLCALQDSGFGGCLADDMGLGKTVQVLAFFAAQKNKRSVCPALLVAPRTLVGNWIAEASRFFPNMRVAEIPKLGKPWRCEDADLWIVTFRSAVIRIQDLSAVAWTSVVVDEAQALKNRETQTARAVRSLRAEFRLALTGTPVENSFEDLVSIFAFLNPGMFDRAEWVRSMIDKGLDVSSEDLSVFRSAVSPFLLRRKKSEVLCDLPAKEEVLLTCDLEGEQKQHYEEILAHYQSELKNNQSSFRKPSLVLEALLRLRQVALHPALISEVGSGITSAKMKLLLGLVAELCKAGHKVLVFSSFVSFLKILSKMLTEMEIGHETLDGQSKDRDGRVKRFQTDPQVSVFLLSLKAGGTGLNLTAASYAFLMDPWWNPSAERQAIDRMHRIGQKNAVTAYRIVAKGTVEERVLELQRKKNILVEQLLGDDAGPPRSLNIDELQELLFS